MARKVFALTIIVLLGGADKNLDLNSQEDVRVLV